jgi:hypothetical protein
MMMMMIFLWRLQEHFCYYVFLTNIKRLDWIRRVCVCLRKRFRKGIVLSPFKTESGRRRGREMHEECCIIPARISLVS